MGKKLYTKDNISLEKTNLLGIDELQVIDNEGDDKLFFAIHKRYFQNEKCTCPVCGSKQTRCSKVVRRKLKDIIYHDEDDFKVIDLVFYQRYLRCNKCNDIIFPEEVSFAEKGCRYTNRLADKLADGTFEQSYQKVCDNYGVPASTASVGEIMRRRIKYREKHLYPFRSPELLCIIMVNFYGAEYPMVLGVCDTKIYCMDILRDSSEETCFTFFKSLNPGCVKTIYVDPVDSIYNAANYYFPAADIVISPEAILRYARNAMLKIIHSDAKRFPITNKKEWALTESRSFGAIDLWTAKKIESGMKERPRLHRAYNIHQNLMEIMNEKWTLNDLHEWVNSIPDEINEFDEVKDIVEIYEPGINNYLLQGNQQKNNYRFEVQGICDAINEMPKCIFDVLRGRCFFNINPDNVSGEGTGIVYRYGINSHKFKTNINKITEKIIEEKYQ